MYQRVIRNFKLGLAVFALCHSAASGQTAKQKQRLDDFYQRYPRADLDGDGVLTMDEARVYKARLGTEPAHGKQPAAASQPQPSHSDVAYGPQERNVLDLWLAGSESPTPILIFFHGGSFKAGDKSSFAKRVAPYLEAGISVASANYRFSTQAPYPAPMLDGGRAVQFIRATANRWNIDPHKIALSGSSAGGTLALWIALHDDLADPGSDDPVARQSTRVCCFLGLSAPCSLEPQFIFDHFGTRNIGNAMLQLFGVKDREAMMTAPTAELVRQASPIHHLSPDDPPLLMIHGQDMTPTGLADDGFQSMWIHHPLFSQVLEQACNKIGVECHVYYKSKPAPANAEVQFLARHFARTGR